MQISDTELRILIAGCIDETPAKLKEFYYTFYDTLMKVSVRYAPCQEDAEQWVHDAFLKIYTHLDKFSFNGSFEGWIKKIMTRICLDQLRMHKAMKYSINHQTVTISDYNEIKTTPTENDFYKTMSFQQALFYLNQLPEKQKIVFNMYVVDGYSHKEIADMLATTEHNTHWLLNQARKTLKNLFSKSSKIA